MPHEAYRHLSCSVIEANWTKLADVRTELPIPCDLCKAPVMLVDDPIIRIAYVPTPVEVEDEPRVICEDAAIRRLQLAAKLPEFFPIRGYVKAFKVSLFGVAYPKDNQLYFKAYPLAKYTRALYDSALAKGIDIPLAKVLPEISGISQPSLAELRAARKHKRHILAKDVAEFSSDDVLREAKLAYDGLHESIKTGSVEKGISAVTFGEYIENRDFFDSISQKRYDQDVQKIS